LPLGILYEIKPVGEDAQPGLPQPLFRREKLSMLKSHLHSKIILVLTTLMMSFPLFAAEVCGRVSFKRSNGLNTVRLADLQSEAEPVYFFVTNPEGYAWKPGSCVCAQGKVTCERDADHCQIEIGRLNSVDPSGTDCLPTWFP